MKKLFPLIVLIIGIVAVHQSVLATAALPANAIWYEPTTATANTPITLHALVYNNQSSDATVTVEFTTPASAGAMAREPKTIATATMLVPAQGAKTLSATWTMPATSTVISGTITAAVTANHTPLKALLGSLGTMTISPSLAPATTGVSLPSFPGSSKITAWFTPFLAKIEAFRIKEAAYFTHLRDTSKVAAGLVIVSNKTTDTSTTPATDATNKIFSHPSDYFNYFYASALAPVFATAIIFYVLLVIAILLVIRFIVNLVL